MGLDPTAVNYVPHSGGGEALASLAGNQVAAGVNGLGELAALIEAGRLRALAISSEARLPGVDIPTFMEQGVDLALSNWRGVVAPPGLSPEQRAVLTRLMDEMARSPVWKAALATNNWVDMYQSGPAFEAFLKQEDARAADILRSIGLLK